MYKVLGVSFSSWLRCFFPLRWFAGVHVKPTNFDKANFERRTGSRPTIFVMSRFQLLDLWVLNYVLRRFGLAPVRREARSNAFLHSAFLAIRLQGWLFLAGTRKDPFTEYLEEILKNDARVQEGGICLQPVSVFWSRAAERTDRNFLIRGLFPDDGNANFLQKLLLFVFHGGRVDIHFGNTYVVTNHSVPELNSAPSAAEPSAESAAVSELTPAERAKRFRRVLLAELNRERTAALGPALYEFNTVANWILQDPETKKMIEDGPGKLRNQKRAYHYLKEIAASYNYTTVRAFEVIFDFVWTKIFKGVRIRNFESVREVARTGRILWIPCHRSHLDYMLLSYVLFKAGLACPHIAAGVNLSFWPAGPVLRRGGAFFLRRSFSGNKLYARIFSSYVDFLMHNGYPIEFFHEGGRSRIGKLMTPRFGITSICVRSILRRKAAATYVVPVFIGYDKVMEDDAYAREVSGAKKHKESAWQLLRSVRYLFSNYGRVDLSFGTPIHFGDFWKEYVTKHESMGRIFRPQAAANTAGKEAAPELQLHLEELSEEIDQRHPIVQSFVESLAFRVNEGINAAGVASGTSLLAVVYLSLGQISIDVDRLKSRFEHAAWIVDSVRRILRWKVSNSFSALEGSFSLSTGELQSLSRQPQVQATPLAKESSPRSGEDSARSVREGYLHDTQPANEILSRREERGERRVHETHTSERTDEVAQQELSGALCMGNANREGVVSVPLVNQEAQAAFYESVEACLKWQFLTEESTEQHAGSRPNLRRSDTKFLNWYWYRGTVFHIFAVPGIAAKIIQKYRDNKVEVIDRAALLSVFDAIRNVWKLELFWPRELPSEKLLDCAIEILEGMGVIVRLNEKLKIVSDDEFVDDLDFLAGFVTPEKEIYGLQLAAALQLMESQGAFKRDELIAQAFVLHRSAFLRGLVSQPASLSRVYGQRSFEAMLNMGVYVTKTGSLLRISYEALQPLVEFFDINELNDVKPY